MSTQIREAVAADVLPIEQLRAEVLGPTIARLIRDDYEHGTREFPHYSASVGGTFGLDASQTWCPLCGSGFDPTRPQFAYVCDKTSALWQRDPRVGRALVVLHGACVRLAQSTGLALDDWFAQMAADEKAVALNERGD